MPAREPGGCRLNNYVLGESRQVEIYRDILTW